jgi:hypothetical protein
MNFDIILTNAIFTVSTCLLSEIAYEIWCKSSIFFQIYKITVKNFVTQSITEKMLRDTEE